MCDIAHNFQKMISFRTLLIYHKLQFPLACTKCMSSIETRILPQAHNACMEVEFHISCIHKAFLNKGVSSEHI